MKQSKSEVKKALLCQLWGGRGDTNLLANGSRGFDRTTMSTCVVQQPVCLKEITNLCGKDGFIGQIIYGCRSTIAPDKQQRLHYYYGDESQRFLLSISMKQSKSEVEKHYYASY